jgi:predicted NAD/FAD-binding protein
MSGAIWSCALETMLEYPAQSFVRFFKNHGLLTVSDQPQWYTVSGGSKNYVKKIIDKIGQNALISDEVLSVERTENNKVLVKSKNGEKTFDKVVFATHANDTLNLIKNPNKLELEILSSFKYQRNLAVLHRDSQVMPNAKKAWSSWVYSNNKNNKSQISISYWMNNLQNIDSTKPLFVTLNPNQNIALNKVFATYNYEHPIFDSSAIKAQSRIEEIQGIDNFYFCGAYQKYGFHEDGISSALNAIKKLGVSAPWNS